MQTLRWIAYPREESSFYLMSSGAMYQGKTLVSTSLYTSHAHRQITLPLYASMMPTTLLYKIHCPHPSCGVAFCPNIYQSKPMRYRWSRQHSTMLLVSFPLPQDRRRYKLATRSSWTMMMTHPGPPWKQNTLRSSPKPQESSVPTPFCPMLGDFVSTTTIPLYPHSYSNILSTKSASCLRP